MKSMSPESVELRRATDQDMALIAALHRAQFGDHFLGQYPAGLIADFYRSFLQHNVFVVAMGGGAVLGFVLGGAADELDRSRRVFLRRTWAALTLATVLRPRLWPQAAVRGFGILRERRHGGFASRATCRLLSIAVAENAKGLGVAQALVTAFEAALPAGEVYGLSVHDDNARAVTFYRKYGFQEEGHSKGTFFFIKPVGRS